VYGFVKRFEAGSQRYHPIISATNMDADTSLQNQQISIRLDWLYAYEYPPSLLERLGLGDNMHTILFSFEARNQVVLRSKHVDEHVAFNQIYRAKSRQSVATTGHPVFIGINVGKNGINFHCKTMNVSNSDDQKLVDAISSPAMKLGLNLLTTAQPALAPFVGLAIGLFKSLANKNEVVHEFTLGLDFQVGATGARIAEGTYVIAQVSNPDEWNWHDWSYDAESGIVVKTNLAQGEKPYTLRHNSLMFRVSRYQP
jgi:hypothetical protein